MCRNSSSGFLVLTKLGMKIPEKQRGRGDRMERNGIMGWYTGIRRKHVLQG